MTGVSDTAETAFELSAAERQVLAAVRARQPAELDHPQLTDRVLRGQFLEYLIVECCRAEAAILQVQIRGAEVRGRFHPPPESRRQTLVFRDCRFEQPVDVSGCDFLSLRFVNCQMPAFIGASLVTQADVDLSGSRFAGVHGHTDGLADVGSAAVFLSNARIGGKLLMRSTDVARFEAHAAVYLDGLRVESTVDCDGGFFDGCGGVAISARSARIGANVELRSTSRHRCEVLGEVALVAARIVGDLNCFGSRLQSPKGRALHCEDLAVESVFMGSPANLPWTFEASGRLNFLSATVGGTFALTNARLAPGPEKSALIPVSGPVALNLQQATVSNALVLANISALDDDPSSRTAVRGWFILRGARVNVLLDSTGPCWPEAGFLELDGLSYQRIMRADGGDVVATRCEWLLRQFAGGVPSAGVFSPQPYEELSRALRASGQAREAGAIAVEKIRMRLAAKVDRLPSRLFARTLLLLSHHGYSSSRAALSFVVFVLCGALLYSTAIWMGQTFVPFNQQAEPTVYSLPFNLATVSAARGCPDLDVIQFALDVALPLINLGHDTYCRFAPAGSVGWVWQLLHSAFGIGGAALSAVLVLTLTGVLRRDG